ncbi:uncharacterized protein FIBRA_07866 [Fibroporia radiculosa]|uniref:Clp1-like protein n=1 Tax=Fibroporia radiculosa TaxID=599839 RepID=J4I1J4_9APHY|nr:uncharacterized protein FIBRA_07866 [Fibroporia radiculosa]CCM05637.1 predicted protein [Fibroporia radiculosa]
MFQVTSRPVSELTLPMSHSSPALSQTLHLPRHLARPAFTDVSRDAIRAVEKDLADTPVPYVRQHLAGQAEQMRAAHSLLIYPDTLPRARLASSLDVSIRPASGHLSTLALPTHMLAISSSRTSPSAPNTPTAASFLSQASSASTVSLFPVYALVLAAHCALLPPLPRAHTSTNRSVTVTLPVVPLTVPSAETFGLLYEFLHTQRADTLLAAFLPSLAAMLPPKPTAGTSSTAGKPMYAAQFSNESLLRLAHALASSAASHAGPQGALTALMGLTRRINGVWRNACALGVFDAELWGVMDVAWEIVLAAMTRVHERERA